MPKICMPYVGASEALIAAAAEALSAAGIDVIEGCTLVMLKTGQY